MRTFIDANILIAAATGRDALFDRAWAMLDDPERVFFTSEFVRLEVMPKAVYFQHQDEHDVYVNFFTNLAEFVPCSDTPPHASPSRSRECRLRSFRRPACRCGKTVGQKSLSPRNG